MSREGIEILLSLVTALAAGLLIGAERQQGDRRALFAGVRTFPLFALAGALGMLIGSWALFGMALGVGAIVALAYYRSSGGRSRIGTSTETAALVTFGLGALCTARHLPLSLSDRLLLVAAGASMVMGLLTIKQPLQTFLSKISWDDIYATAKLLLLTVILLPTLPARYMGPFEALSPQKIGVFVVLVSAVGFAGYIAIRIAGPSRGLGLTGFFGGLASSTAVTLSFAGKARESRSLVKPCAVAITLASSTNFPRTVMYAAAASPELGWKALGPLVAASVAGFVGTAVLASIKGPTRVPLRTSQPPENLKFENPFSLGRALRFGTIFTAVLLFSNAAAALFSEAGVFFASAFSGIINMDATTLSIAKLHQRGLLSRASAVDAIGLSALTSTLFRIGLSSFLGGRALGIRVGVVLLFTIAVGFITRIVLLGWNL